LNAGSAGKGNPAQWKPLGSSVGNGGIVAEEANRRFSERHAYVIISPPQNAAREVYL